MKSTKNKDVILELELNTPWHTFDTGYQTVEVDYKIIITLNQRLKPDWCPNWCIADFTPTHEINEDTQELPIVKVRVYSLSKQEHTIVYAKIFNERSPVMMSIGYGYVLIGLKYPLSILRRKIQQIS